MTASAEYAKLQRKFENIHSTYRSLKEAEAAQREEVADLTARLAEAEAGSGEEFQTVCAERDNLQRRLDNVRETHRETAKEEAARREELASYQTLLDEAERERELSVQSARAEAEKEIENLKRRLENVRETNRSFKEGERGQREEVQSLHKQLVDARIQRDELLAKTKKAAEQELAGLKRQLEEANSKTEGSAKEGTSARLTEALAEVSRERDAELAAIAEAASAQRADADRQIMKLRAELDAALKTEQNSRERFERLETEAGALKVKLRKLSEASAASGEVPTGQDEKIASLMKRIDELVSEKRALAEELKSGSEAMGVLQAQLLDKESVISGLKSSGSMQQSEGDAASSELEEAAQALKDSKRETEDLRVQSQVTHSKLKAAEERRALDQKELEELKAELNEAKAAAESGAKELAAQAEAALTELKAVKAELNEKAKELKLATRELEGISEELVGARTDAKAAAERYARELEQVQSLEAELEAQRVSFKELTEEKAAIAEAGAVVTDDLKAVSVELDGKRQELEHKSGKLRAATRELNELSVVLAQRDEESKAADAAAKLDAEKLAKLEEELKTERAATERAISLKDKDTKELMAELEAQDQRWNASVERLAKLEEQLLVKAELEAQLTEEGALQIQLAEQAEQIAALSKEKGSSEENSAAAALMIAQLEEELTAERAKAQVLEEARSQQEQRSEQGVKTITRLERELDAKRELLSSMEAELAAQRESEVQAFTAAPEPSIFSEALSNRATMLA